MKLNFITKTVFFIAALLLLLVAPVAIAQDVVNENPTAEYSAGFETFAALVAIIPFVTEIFKKLIPNASSLGKQVFSWIIGLVIAAFGWVFNLGFLADLTWYIALLYGAGASLAANGIFDTGLITWLVGLISNKNK
ncbi:MAG: hypothetical protein LBJ72_12795 [Dysgonamonadaceae bacterium]|jgi:hypothetical protein|nr:hypothetical protein [Dysgonamonadaceae bacterium]